jgi:hypothetical protein
MKKRNDMLYRIAKMADSQKVERVPFSDLPFSDLPFLWAGHCEDYLLSERQAGLHVD